MANKPLRRFALTIGLALIAGLSLCTGSFSASTPAAASLGASPAHADIQSGVLPDGFSLEAGLQAKRPPVGRSFQGTSILSAGHECAAREAGLTAPAVTFPLSRERALPDAEDTGADLTLSEGLAANHPSRAPLKRIAEDLHVISGGPVHLSSRRLLPVVAAAALLVAFGPGPGRPPPPPTSWEGGMALRRGGACMPWAAEEIRTRRYSPSRLRLMRR